MHEWIRLYAFHPGCVCYVLLSRHYQKRLRHSGLQRPHITKFMTPSGPLSPSLHTLAAPDNTFFSFSTRREENVLLELLTDGDRCVSAFFCSDDSAMIALSVL